jgi:hypothetical protein
MLLKLFGLTALLAVCSAQKLPVAVYYESLCSDTIRFFREQLHPVKSSPLGQYFELTLIPFGKANFSTQGSDVLFTCQHGPNECYGNKLHACALAHIQVDSYQKKHTRESLSLEYVTCLLVGAEASQEAPIPGERCAQELELKNWDVIKQCANGTEGSKLLQTHGETTHNLKPELTFVPTIVIKHQYTKETQDLALNDLRSAVCRALPQPKPHECNLGSGASSNDAMIFVVFIATGLVAYLNKLF